MLTSSSFKKNHDYIYQQALKWQANLLYFFFSQAQPKNQRKLGAAQWPIVNKRLTGRKKKKRWGERKEVKK